MSRATALSCSLMRAFPLTESVMEMVVAPLCVDETQFHIYDLFAEPQHIVLLGGQMPAQVSDEDT